MSKLQQKKEQKKEAIVQAAREIFLSEGYIQTSMDQIAKHANVTKQTVYRYFESKEMLFQASLRAHRDGSHHHFLEELEKEDTGEALKSFAVSFIKSHMSDTHLTTLRILISEGPRAPEMTRAFYAVAPKETEQHLTKFLKERFHLEDSEHEIRMLFSMLLSMRMRVLVGLLSKPSEEEIEEFAQKTIDMYMKALAG